MHIKILGPGCTNCRRLHAETEKAIGQSRQRVTLSRVEAIEDIVGYGVMRTPALVIDDRVVSSGRIPGAAEIVAMINAAVAKA